MSDLQIGVSKWVRCSQAFLFSMVNYSGLGKTKMPLFKSHEHAIEAGHRPMFGAGHDLNIIIAIIFIGNKAGRLRLI